MAIENLDITVKFFLDSFNNSTVHSHKTSTAANLITFWYFKLCLSHIFYMEVREEKFYEYFFLMCDIFTSVIYLMVLKMEILHVTLSKILHAAINYGMPRRNN